MLVLCLGAVVVLGFYAFAMTRSGYAWPAPQVLPKSFEFKHVTYELSDGCQTPRDLRRRLMVDTSSLRLVGHIPSALYVGQVDLLGDSGFFPGAALYVKHGGCYREYGISRREIARLNQDFHGATGG